MLVLLSSFSSELFHFFELSPEHSLLLIFFSVAIIFALSFVSHYLSLGTPLPSFVVAIFFGMAAKPVLAPIVEHHEVLASIVGFGATLILFGGGIETPFSNFRKLFWKIAVISFFGLLLTAFLFSHSLNVLAPVLGSNISIVTMVLLGAVLASTDPASIIPILKSLRFKNRSTKDIIVSESAVTDVTGALLTVTFLTLIVSGTSFPNINEWYQSVFSVEAGMFLLKQLFYGSLFGVIGYFSLELLQDFKKGHEKEFEADFAFFIFVPIFIFTVSLAFGGSGYLAAFVAGLIFNLKEHLHESERFFNQMIDGFFKPAIFILLGALVEPSELLDYAAIGIIASLIFMLLIRPLTVFLSLGAFSFFGKDRFSWRELLFISFVRETGAIPAALIVTVATAGITGIEGLIPIGMWVVLLTLMIEPLLTPWVARKLDVAEPIADIEALDIEKSESPMVVLCTRGHSFLERVPFVAEWCVRHGIEKISVLLCLENKFSVELSYEIEKEAGKKFSKVNAALEAKNFPIRDFSFISRAGFLQDNIELISKEHPNVTAIFVGRKMLDYRMDEVKKLDVPIYFMD